jgi:hypothetical protein
VRAPEFFERQLKSFSSGKNLRLIHRRLPDSESATSDQRKPKSLKMCYQR